MNQVLNANGFVELDEREAMDVDGGAVSKVMTSFVRITVKYLIPLSTAVV